MKRVVLDYLEDMLEDAPIAREFIDDMDYATFAADRRTIYAVLRALEVIGEAAKRVSDDVKSGHAGIDWRGMAGLRDVIVPNTTESITEYRSRR